MKSRIIIFSLLLFTFFACKKRLEPIDEIGSPVFYMSGEINNVPLTLEAGKNNYYLITDYRMDNDNVLEFTGNLKQNCSTCKAGLKIILRDYKKSTGYLFRPDSSFEKHNYDFSRNGLANIPYYTIKLNAVSTGSAALVSELWQFSDGSSETTAQVNKTLKSGTVQPIKYTCSYSNGCSSSINNKLKLNYFLNPNQLPEFSYTSLDSSHNIYKFYAIGDPSNIYLWDFGDGKIIKGKTIFYGFSSNKVVNVSLKQINGTDTMEISKNIRTGSNTDCLANFSTELIPVEDPYNFSTVMLEWTDESGVTYSSAEIKQDLNTNFSLLSSESFKTNASGMKTRLLKLLINCKLSNGSNTIEIKNLEGKMAVAHP
ncbi:MAG: hypothetical protein Q8M15_11345 [Bacteroidota bacterium]|nr:hypothetical protein [Bacteroidota bacterium]